MSFVYEQGLQALSHLERMTEMAGAALVVSEKFAPGSASAARAEVEAAKQFAETFRVALAAQKRAEQRQEQDREPVTPPAGSGARPDPASIFAGAASVISAVGPLLDAVLELGQNTGRRRP